MAEQSHLEAMREAIKGDLERARSRNPSIFERPAVPAAEIRAEPQPPPDPEPPVVEPEPVSDAPAPVAVEPEPQPEPEPEAAAEPRRSFFSRLAFWR
jgi:hypothetical protein